MAPKSPSRRRGQQKDLCPCRIIQPNPWTPIPQTSRSLGPKFENCVLPAVTIGSDSIVASYVWCYCYEKGNCTRMGYNEASNGNVLFKFWDEVSAQSARVENPKQSYWPTTIGQTCRPQTSAINCKYSLRNSSQRGAVFIYLAAEDGNRAWYISRRNFGRKKVGYPATRYVSTYM